MPVARPVSSRRSSLLRPRILRGQRGDSFFEIGFKTRFSRDWRARQDPWTGGGDRSGLFAYNKNVRRDSWWLIGLVLVVCLGARFLTTRLTANDTIVGWKEEIVPDHIVCIRVQGNRLNGGRVTGDYRVGSLVVRSLDERVSAADFATLLDTAEMAGAWTVDDQQFFLHLPAFSFHIERAGRCHDIRYDSPKEFDVFDEAIRASLIGRCAYRLTATDRCPPPDRGRCPRRCPRRHPRCPPPPPPRHPRCGMGGPATHCYGTSEIPIL